MPAQNIVALFDSHCLKHLLLFLVADGKIHGNLVHQRSRLFHLRIPLKGVLVQLGIMGGKRRKIFFYLTDKRFLFRFAFFLVSLLCQLFHAGFQKSGVFFLNLLYFSPADSLHQYSDYLVGKLGNLFYHADCSHVVNLLPVRVFHTGVLLGSQKKPPPACHGVFKGLNRLFPVQVKMDNNPRQYGDSTQGNHGQHNKLPFRFLFTHKFILCHKMPPTGGILLTKYLSCSAHYLAVNQQRLAGTLYCPFGNHTFFNGIV